MIVEQDRAGRFMVRREKPPGFDGKIDLFGSRIDQVTESAGTARSNRDIF